MAVPNLITDDFLDGLQITRTYNVDGSIATEACQKIFSGGPGNPDKVVNYLKTWTYPDAVTSVEGVWVGTPV